MNNAYKQVKIIFTTTDLTASLEQLNTTLKNMQLGDKYNILDVRDMGDINISQDNSITSARKYLIFYMKTIESDEE